MQDDIGRPGRPSQAEPVVSALRASVPDAVEAFKVRFDPHYRHFGVVGDPVEHKQHPNQRCGLDLYVTAINFDTGEHCFKKLYENKRGLYFKHTGYSPMYLADFTQEAVVLPFQVHFPSPVHAPNGEQSNAG